LDQATRVALLLMIFFSPSVWDVNLAQLSTNESLYRTSVHPLMQKVQRNQPKRPRIDYSIFSHLTHVTTQKLSCDSCHKIPSKNWKEVRQGDAAFADVTDFPEHSTCLNCHRQQFFARQRPAPAICSNCHVKVTPRDTARFVFPSLGDVAVGQRRDLSSEFSINFPHDKHLDVVARNPGPRRSNAAAFFLTVGFQEKADAASCPVCHQTYQPQGKSDKEYVAEPPKNLDDAFWLKKGSFKTLPNNHKTCFSCHNPDLGIEPVATNCDGCHKLGPAVRPKADFVMQTVAQMGADQTMLREWGSRFSSGTFRHEGGDHPNLGCRSCHLIEVMKTVEPATFKVSMKSCGGADGCHITATADDGGILNYEIDQKKAKPSFVCTKCHIEFGKAGIPQSHIKAIEALKK
jgi:hypothetical protein